ncbi:MAG: hypothetical protein APF84_14595 [Gracilibacter sp. BRH_c7a]|nr:MAG: hypothetical protein APF84_14595 [Gracilibacter sp. BRH_c7a]
MEKILVVFTGGTIGSTKTDKTINVDDNTSYYLIDRYNNSEYKREVSFDVSQPMSLLSEDLIPKDWLTLHETLSQLDLSVYKGIIITHGTDTLPFTAAAISYLFNWTPIPIVITASNYPLEDERSNGFRNFVNSVEFIINDDIPGVFVIFENNKGESIVHLGTRLTQAVPFTHEFDSISSIIFGKMKDNKFQKHEHVSNPSFEDLKKPKDKADLPDINFSTDVVYIKPFPGLNYQHYDFSVIKPQAIIHDLYHSGTACTRTDGRFKYSLIEFTKDCIDNDIEVFISPIRDMSEDMYVTSNDILEAGAHYLHNISIEASIVKLMLAYGSAADNYNVLKIMREPFFYEYI